MLGFNTPGSNPVGSPYPFERVSNSNLIFVTQETVVDVDTSSVSYQTINAFIASASAVNIITSSSNSSINNVTVNITCSFLNSGTDYLVISNTIFHQLNKTNFAVNLTNSKYKLNLPLINFKSSNITPSYSNNFITKGYADSKLTTTVSTNFIRKVALILDWND